MKERVCFSLLVLGGLSRLVGNIDQDVVDIEEGEMTSTEKTSCLRMAAWGCLSLRNIGRMR